MCIRDLRVYTGQGRSLREVRQSWNTLGRVVLSHRSPPSVNSNEGEMSLQRAPSVMPILSWPPSERSAAGQNCERKD
jgi:hypothetical protein